MSFLSAYGLDNCSPGDVNGTHYCGEDGVAHPVKVDLCNGNIGLGCGGIPLSCSNFNQDDVACNIQQGCFWDRQCTGIAHSCDSIPQNSCLSQQGCSLSEGILCSNITSEEECNSYYQCGWMSELITGNAVAGNSGTNSGSGSCQFQSGSVLDRSDYCSGFDGNANACVNAGCEISYASCVNDYECATGTCNNGICKSDYKEIKEHTGFLESFWNRLVDYFTIGGGEVLDTNPPVLTLNGPSSNGYYYPDSNIIVNVHVVDESNEITWRLMTEGGEITHGVLTGENGVDSDVTYNLGSVRGDSTGRENDLYFDAVDAGGLRTALEIRFFVKNENCNDNVDNDGDGITDSLDADCASEGAQRIETGEVTTNPENEIYTYRKLDISCNYEVTGEVGDLNIENCVRIDGGDLNLANCEDKTISDGVVEYNNCDVGGNEGQLDISCYVNPYCNSNSYVSSTTSLNVIKYSICDAGDVGDGLSMELKDPSEGDNFYAGEEVNTQVRVTNQNLGNNVDVVVKSYLYDVDGEDRISNIGEDSASIDEGDRSDIESSLNVSEDVVEDNSNRLYYKAYVDGSEDEICISDSISLDLRESNDCIDEDGDGYCDYEDCDDGNEFINPGETEFCTDNIDNNCNGLVDEDDTGCTISVPGPGGSRDIIPGVPYNAGTITPNGIRVLMQIGSVVNFNMDSGPHSITLKSISGSDVLLTISSEPFDVLIRPNQIKDVDLDKDGTNDIRLKLNGFVNGKIDLTVRSILYSTSNAGTINLPGSSENPQQTSNAGTWIMVLIIFIIILGISIFLYILYKRKKKEFDGHLDGDHNLFPKRPFPPRKPFFQRKPIIPSNSSKLKI